MYYLEENSITFIVLLESKRRQLHLQSYLNVKGLLYVSNKLPVKLKNWFCKHSLLL